MEPLKCHTLFYVLRRSTRRVVAVAVSKFSNINTQINDGFGALRSFIAHRRREVMGLLCHMQARAFVMFWTATLNRARINSR